MSGFYQHDWNALNVFPAPVLRRLWLKRTREALEGGALPFWGNVGWAKFTRKVVLTHTIQQAPDALGALLSAEWVDRHGRSCRIDADPLAPGALAIFTLEEVEEQSSEYTPVWREKVVIDGDGAAAGRKLIYHVYMAEREGGELRRLCDAFRGWED